MKQLTQFYNNKTVLVTGHTGFKGSWLSLWLDKMGATVVGLSLPYTAADTHSQQLALPIKEYFIDIRDSQQLSCAILEIKPDYVFHLAACTLVRQSYQDPLTTWQTNVQGTANLLDACSKLDDLSGILVVTTDKVYDNKEWNWGYRETDEIAGMDPYSASKAACELLTKSYASSYFSAKGIKVATARAGNVIGGGDWAEDRLFPDVIRALQNSQVLKVRNPKATRPWQHVLDCLSGYLLLMQHLVEEKNEPFSSWNFGPETSANLSVEQCLSEIKSILPDFNWQNASDRTWKESQLLYLDSSKARSVLQWQPVWDFKQAIHQTMFWYQAWLTEGKIISTFQLDQYLS